MSGQLAPLRESRAGPVALSNGGTADFRSEKIRLLRRRRFFHLVAKHAFPRKTAANLSALTGYSERAIYDWMAARSDAPAMVLLLLLGEIGRLER
jgi:hypothetical protein